METYIKKIARAIDQQDKALFLSLFGELIVTDQIVVYNALSEAQKERVFEYLDLDAFAQLFEHLEIDQQLQYLDKLTQTQLVDILNRVHDGDVALFLNALPEETRNLYLSKMDALEAFEASQLMDSEAETAGSIMTTEFMAVSSTQTAGEVMAMLRTQSFDAEMIYYLYVVNEAFELVGVLSLRELIIAPKHELVENVMLSQVHSVMRDEDQEAVARIFKKYHFLALPVISETKQLVGIITVDDVMDVVTEEAQEDIEKFVGGSLDTNLSVLKAATKRAPWIALMIFFGLGLGGIIESFEHILEETLILAAFIPLIMGAAGNTGTQVLAVIVRKLAAEGEVNLTALIGIMKREFKTGLMLGLICAVTMMVSIPFLFPEGGIQLAVIVGTSLFLTLCVSTIVGALVPVMIAKLKIDPAVASGPFITTINDVIGLLIYFGISTMLLNLL